MAKYKVTQEMLNDIKAIQTLPIERNGLFLKNSIVAQMAYTDSRMQNDRQTYDSASKLIGTLPPMTSLEAEKYRTETEKFCISITNHLKEKNIEFGIMVMPSMPVFVENDNDEQLVNCIPIVARSYIVTLDDFKSLCKFIFSSKKCLWLYEAYITDTLKEGEFILRCAILIRSSIPTFSEFEIDTKIPVDVSTDFSKVDDALSRLKKNKE